MTIRDIVNVEISRETTAVSQAGFGTLLIVGENAEFSERLRYYTSPDGVAEDFGENDAERKAADLAFSQSPRVERIAIGRKDELETWTEALDAIQSEEDDWYGLMITSRTQEDQEATADWVEARIKLAGLATSDSDVIDGSADSDIASYLQDNSIERTFALYHPDAADEYPEAAWFGDRLPSDPGSSTWAFKTLSGVEVYSLSETEKTAVLDKSANIYTRVGGVNITRLGTVGSGEYIDVIRGVDWLQARMTEAIFSRLVNLPKIPYTDAGVQIVTTEMRAVLDRAIDRDVIAANPAYEIDAPRVRDVPFNDRANRVLPDLRFRATLAGAIHRVEIQGVVTV